MSLGLRIMVAKAGRPPWTMERQADMTNHNGVLMMQRLLLAGTLGLAMAQKAAAILEGEPGAGEPGAGEPGAGEPGAGEQAAPDPVIPVLGSQQAPDPRSDDGVVLRAILDAANECLGHF